MVDFTLIKPNEIINLTAPEVKYLEDAIKRTPASTSRLDVTLDIAAKGYGNMYRITNMGNLIGMTYLLTYDTPEGKIVCPVLVGGDDMWLWKEDFEAFLRNYGKQIGSTCSRFIARKGWKKMFPRAKIIGYIFEHT